MASKQMTQILLAVLAICLIAFVGCSEKSFVSHTTEFSQNASPIVYIPLEQGLRVNYVTLEPEVEYYDIEIVNPVTVAGTAGFTFRRTNRASNETTIWYQYNKGVAIFKSSNKSDPGMRILESPFVAGNKWNIYDTSSYSGGGGGSGDGIDDNDDIGKDDGLTNFGDYWKVIPDADYSTMQIVGFEMVEALNGTNYGHCLKVQWQTDSLGSNFYWYAAGIGLVKFERTSESIYQRDNNIVTIMTDFQTVEY